MSPRPFQRRQNDKRTRSEVTLTVSPDSNSRIVPEENDDPNWPLHPSRRIPFILRVGAVWARLEDVPGEDESDLGYWQRATMTGALTATSGGRDVGFSDLEVV